MLKNKLSTLNDDFLRLKIVNFKYMFIVFNVFSLLLLFLVVFTIYYNDTSPLPFNSNDNFYFGFYNVIFRNSKFVSTDINWIGIVLSVITIFYVLYICIFYWAYWNNKWQKYIINSTIIALFIMYGVLIVGGLIVGFINSPFLDFVNVDPTKGFITSDTINSIRYNFIYDCWVGKNNLGIVNKYSFQLSEYGILLIVVQASLIFSLIVTKILIIKKWVK